ncbi:LysR family transcriptional regulator [Candidatus Methylospira mobilis]|uniref:LysR family transcriptional regulator n=1 Tax=Candidatus Methylospira mobilis TaxID=1808979 RepID=A0A5Q0BCH5_9GAMM|nr:LysR family transcriptional regulator [Candidatus Methylospira mobilis]QFY41500.1 LysR family transcriptional regulator [Candidatus Methylospira mobilis]WNV05271.1 LysR family transcriptional regulator [Candidatus Methylospira mobilis]
MFIRQIHYLLALAKTGHFGRAAEACNVTQPALSTALQHLEEELKVTIVQRDQRFQGFTPEGERLLQWARILAQDWEGMRQEAALCNQQLVGSLRLGAIPTTLAVAPLLTEPCLAKFPGVRIKLVSLSMEDLIQQLDGYELDLGLTYLEDPRLKGFRVLPLYRERHVLLARDASFRVTSGHLSWADAANLPLCLLTPNMQNRRVIDAAFRDAGVYPNVALETDSVFALYSHVRCAGLYSVVPHSLLSLFEMRQEVTVIPLKPELSRPIGLISRKQDNTPPVQEAAWNIALSLDLQARFDTLINAMN